MFIFWDTIFHLDVHYVCMFVQRFEPQGRRFTNFHYYYHQHPACFSIDDLKQLTITIKDNGYVMCFQVSQEAELQNRHVKVPTPSVLSCEIRDV